MINYQANKGSGKIAATACVSEQEAWDYLNSNQDCAAPCPGCLYRGQANRHFRHWPPTATCGLTKHQYELDSIVPTDYRGLEGAVAAGTASSIPLYSNDAAHLRSILTWGVVVEHSQSLSTQDHQVVMPWLQSQTQQTHPFDAVGSIGQHYGLMTGYTDASSSLAVAFWMATRQFGTGAYIYSGHSVIYRWKLNNLQLALTSVNTTSGWNGPAEARLVDIRNIPSQIGSRPQNQSGWSLINCESVAVLLELISNDAVEVVVFPRTGPCQDNNLTFDFIKPPDENIASIFSELIQGQLYSQVRQQELDQWRQNNHGVLPHINLCDPQFRQWVIK